MTLDRTLSKDAADLFRGSGPSIVGAAAEAQQRRRRVRSRGGSAESTHATGSGCPSSSRKARDPE